jgi:PncC family amidohydrolase
MIPVPLETTIAQQLINQKKTLAIAESCSGGLLSHRLTNVPGSSKFLIAGVVSYSNTAKMKILRIPEQLLRRYGAVSEQVAKTMARQVRRLFTTDFGVGITGIAGPDGGSKQKPVGLVYISVNTKVESLTLKCQFQGTRGSIKRQATDQALKILNEFLR